MIYVPDTMARATLDVGNKQAFGGGADGDTVIAGAQGSAGDGDGGRALDVDAVGVGALVGGLEFHVSH